MLSKDDVATLPEGREVIAMLLKVITGRAGSVNSFQADMKTSMRLLKMAKKYDIEGTSKPWIESLVERFISLDPFECFAVACECNPVETQLAKRAIKLFPSDPIPYSTLTRYFGRRDFSGDDRDKKLGECLGIRAEYAKKTDPGSWNKAYVERLGFRNFLAYVKAWHSVYIHPLGLDLSLEPTSREKLEQLAGKFCAILNDEPVATPSRKVSFICRLFALEGY
jgi:hypothetical protein